MNRPALAAIALVAALGLSGCLAPVPVYDDIPGAEHSTDLTSCDELVPASVLESSGVDPMSATDEYFGDDPPYSVIPENRIVQRLGGLACYWAGPEPEYDPDVLFGATRTTLVVEALPGVGERWQEMHKAYGPAVYEASCSTLIAGSALCDGTRPVGDLVISISFSGLALDASLVEGLESGALLDAASDAFSTVHGTIERRVAAATFPPAPPLETPLTVVNGRDCEGLVSHEQIALLADSFTAQSGLMYGSSSLAGVGLEMIGSGECYWTPLFTIDRDDPDWDFEGSEEYEYEEWGGFGVSWLSNAASEIPKGTPVEIAGLPSGSTARARLDTLQPIIDIDFEGHWIAVTAHDLPDVDKARLRFAELVVAALQR